MVLISVSGVAFLRVNSLVWIVYPVPLILKDGISAQVIEHQLEISYKNFVNALYLAKFGGIS